MIICSLVSLRFDGFQYQNANVIETEACYKAARLAIQHNAYLHAANFLHSVMLINLALNEEEKVSSCKKLTALNNLKTNSNHPFPPELVGLELNLYNEIEVHLIILS